MSTQLDKRSLNSASLKLHDFQVAAPSSPSDPHLDLQRECSDFFSNPTPVSLIRELGFIRCCLSALEETPEKAVKTLVDYLYESVSCDPTQTETAQENIVTPEYLFIRKLLTEYAKDLPLDNLLLKLPLSHDHELFDNIVGDLLEQRDCTYITSFYLNEIESSSGYEAATPAVNACACISPQYDNKNIGLVINFLEKHSDQRNEETISGEDSRKSFFAALEILLAYSEAVSFGSEEPIQQKRLAKIETVLRSKHLRSLINHAALHEDPVISPGASSFLETLRINLDGNLVRIDQTL